MRDSYTRKECIEALQNARDVIGHSPSQQEYIGGNFGPSKSTITDEFGSWNSAKEVAGLDENQMGPRIQYTKMDCIESLVEVSDEMGHAPSQGEYRYNKNEPSVQTIKNRFGTWNMALVESKLLPKPKGASTFYHSVLHSLEGKWEEVSSNIRQEDDYECQLCGIHQSKTKRRLTAHHLIPVMSGGVNDESLLMSLCGSCHRTVETFTHQFTERHLRDWDGTDIPKGRRRWTPD